MPVFELEIGARPSEVGQVRRAIRAAVVRYGLDDAHADVTQLLASELVMNAVLHGCPPIVVRLSIERDSTLVEVYDGSDELPTMRPAGDAIHSGRGLRVVDGLSADWGTITAEEGGKTVWCSIAHTTPQDPQHTMRRRKADELSQ